MTYTTSFTSTVTMIMNHLPVHLNKWSVVQAAYPDGSGTRHYHKCYGYPRIDIILDACCRRLLKLCTQCAVLLENAYP